MPVKNINDLAAILGVSKTTISHAMAGKGLVCRRW